MRRMLDPTKVGGIPSTIEFDKDGNRKVNKNLGVDGKLTLKSLVSNTNPDGDITKELGRGTAKKLYKHYIKFWNSALGQVSVQLYNYSDAQLNSKALLRAEIEKNGPLAATGYFIVDNIGYPAREISVFYSDVNVYGLTFSTDNTIKQGQLDVSRFATIDDVVSEVK